jgi:hypothetical protein
VETSSSLLDPPKEQTLSPHVMFIHQFNINPPFWQKNFLLRITDLEGCDTTGRR